MGLPSNPPQLLSAVARLTGVEPRRGREVHIYRVTVTSSDGKTCSINIRVNHKKFFKGNLKQVAHCIRVEAEAIEEVFATWTPEMLVSHLEKFPADVLDSHEGLCRFRERASEQEPASASEPAL